eukprot:m.265867 g.265867  ORF g.265867 m.265867 type:complete len:58 (-) comp64084_c0_seq1:3350-3523(-)
MTDTSQTEGRDGSIFTPAHATKHSNKRTTIPSRKKQRPQQHYPPPTTPIHTTTTHSL